VENIEVTGRGWIDKQRGDFMMKEWEWSSFRFADGDRINLYNFRGGYQVGTYQHADGLCEYFDSFTVIQNGYSKTDDDVWFSFGWTFKLPVKNKKMRVREQFSLIY
jgi:predicted secreted hydrolase